MIISSLILFLCSCSIWTDHVEKVPVPKVKKLSLGTETIVKSSNLVKTGSLVKTSFDLKTDSSITKYIDNKISFDEKSYIPGNLVNLKWDFLIDAKNNQKVRKISLENLEKLSNNFYNNFWKKLKIVSAYRSYSYQKRIKDWGCSDTFCAKAGYSEHQSGLAIDFWEASEKTRFEKNDELKKYFTWMKDNWYKYGFTNSYQNWVEIDWYAIEPWHWRYVWTDLAKILNKEKITFAEYYYKIKK